MKNKMVITLLAGSICFLAACSGDQRPKNGKDTGLNTYKVTKDTAKVDTAKAMSTDNSASGGANLAKDTAKVVKPKK